MTSGANQLTKRAIYPNVKEGQIKPSVNAAVVGFAAGRRRARRRQIRLARILRIP